MRRHPFTLTIKENQGFFFLAEISPLVAFRLPSCGFLQFEFPVMTLALSPATAVFAKRTLSSADSCVFLHRPDLNPTLFLTHSFFFPVCQNFMLEFVMGHV